MKKCFKCNQVLDLSEFYKHPSMLDGHLNKCKSCNKKDSEDRRKEKEKDVNWVLSERKRHREKSRKYREAGKASKADQEYKNKWAKQNPEKIKAHRIVNSALRSGKIHRHPCFICGNKAQAHHDDYSKPLEVIWVCPKHHAEIHIKINEQKLMKKDYQDDPEEYFQMLKDREEQKTEDFNKHWERTRPNEVPGGNTFSYLPKE